MANRVLQQKLLKMKRRGKLKLRSGAPTEVVETLGPHRFIEEGDTVRSLPREMVTVRVIKFSKQVINHSEDGKRRRNIYAEATVFLKDYYKHNM